MNLTESSSNIHSLCCWLQQVRLLQLLEGLVWLPWGCHALPLPHVPRPPHPCRHTRDKEQGPKHHSRKPEDVHVLHRVPPGRDVLSLSSFVTRSTSLKYSVFAHQGTLRLITSVAALLYPRHIPFRNSSFSIRQWNWPQGVWSSGYFGWFQLHVNGSLYCDSHQPYIRLYLQ